MTSDGLTHCFIHKSLGPVIIRADMMAIMLTIFRKSIEAELNGEQHLRNVRRWLRGDIIAESGCKSVRHVCKELLQDKQTDACVFSDVVTSQ